MYACRYYMCTEGEMSRGKCDYKEMDGPPTINNMCLERENRLPLGNRVY